MRPTRSRGSIPASALALTVLALASACAAPVPVHVHGIQNGGVVHRDGVYHGGCGHAFVDGEWCDAPVLDPAEPALAEPDGAAE